MSTPEAVRPEITVLTDEQKDRVFGRIRRRHPTCSGCGADDFLVGDALFVGFLFLSEAQDSYIVALTCANTACPTPHTGITLRESEFLSA